MTKKYMQAKLQRDGYKVTHCMSGKIIAQKEFCGHAYMDDTLTGVFKQVYRPLRNH